MAGNGRAVGAVRIINFKLNYDESIRIFETEPSVRR